MKQTWNMTDTELRAHYAEARTKREVEPKPPMPFHQIMLQYDTNDDGIHVCCTCGWSECLGFGPSPEAAMEKANEHRTNVARIASLTDEELAALSWLHIGK